MHKQDKIIIGRKELASFPGLKIEELLVKIDSGAYSSSIDCSSIKEVILNGSKQLEVVFLHPNNKMYTGEKFLFKHFTHKKVTSSTGNTQVRYLIELNIKFMNTVYTTPFTLTNRSGLKSSVLIGRKLLNKNFLIDTSKKYLTNK
ncbi:RimK/LysX family protein [Crocinitomicaceae bacterium]|nr:RimK/LysX family protein [Crocinitomicaceae bacterium]